MRKRTFIDPPNGWQYGSPAELPDGMTVRELLIRHLYPSHELEWALQNCRRWTENY